MVAIRTPQPAVEPDGRRVIPIVTPIRFAQALFPPLHPDDRRNEDLVRTAEAGPGQTLPGTVTWRKRRELHAYGPGDHHLYDAEARANADLFFTPHAFSLDAGSDDADDRAGLTLRTLFINGWANHAGQAQAAPLVDAAWIEADDADLDPLSLDPPPSIVVETSRRPGEHPRYHCYWIFSDPVPAAQVEAINQGLTYRYLGVDRSGWATAKWLRLPGSTNQGLGKAGGPSPVRIVHWSPETRYRPEDFADVLPVDGPASSAEASTRGGGAPPVRAPALMSDVDLLAKIERSKQGERFRQLMERPAGENRSQHGRYLLFVLCWWTRDRDQIARIFETSRLYQTDRQAIDPDTGRPKPAKWTRPRFLATQIEEVLAMQRSSYSANGYADASPNGHAPARPLSSVEIVGADELMAMVLRPVKWVVPDLLPEGLALLAGRPKLGKSWLALGLAVAVASGGRAVGTTPVEAGDVLYLALEDTRRRLQDRLGKVLGPSPATNGLSFTTAWPRINDGGLDLLDKWLVEHPDARLVVVDTLARVRPPGKNNGNRYDEDYDVMARLKGVADAHGVCLLTVHHVRKAGADDPFDLISGTLGLSGGYDTGLVLQRSRGQADATLNVTGRDVNEQELALRWDPVLCHWSLLGDAKQHAVSSERAAIIELLRDGEMMKPKQIADKLAKPATNVKYLLGRMLDDGTLVNRNGWYALAPLPTIKAKSA